MDRSEKKVKIYDSLNGIKNRRMLNKLAGDILVKALKGDTHEQVSVTELKQKMADRKSVV